MKLTPYQRRFYIDPIQDPLAKTDTILVTEERVNRGRNIDKVVKVTSRTQYDNRVWWITDTGDHVAGAPVSAGLSYGHETMGLYGDDLFIVGQYGGMVSGSCILRSPLRSDGLILPGTGTNPDNSTPVRPSARAKEYLKAAPWASELMPRPEDTSTVTNAKLALAEQRWNHRHAKAVFRNEAIFRDWEDKLEDIDSSHDMLTVYFGALFTGEVMVPLDSTAMPEISEQDKGFLDRLQAKAFKVEPRRTQKVAMTVELPVPISVDSRDDLRKVSQDTVLSHVHNVLDNYRVSLGSYNLTPVLRTAS